VEKRKLKIQEDRLAIARYLNTFITLEDLHFFEMIIYENEVIEKFFKSAREILTLSEQDFKYNFTKQLRSSLYLDTQE